MSLWLSTIEMKLFIIKGYETHGIGLCGNLYKKKKVKI